MFSSDEHIDSLHELTFRLTDAPTVQERALSYLLEVAGEDITESDVRTVLGLPRSTTHMALAALVRQGVVGRRQVGRTNIYAVDPEDPLVRSLKTAHAIRLVQNAISPLRETLDTVVLFGSASSGRGRRGSDIDILVVTASVERALGELSRHQWLQPVVMTSGQHMQLIAEGGTFATEVARGITIWERR